MRFGLCLAFVIAGAACGREAAGPAPIRFLHTFGPEETELFNKLVAEKGLTVDASQVPFARGQQVIGAILRGGIDCPDLIRIDATWLATLATERLLVPVPDALGLLDWTPEAAALVTLPTTRVLAGIPQAVDGLVVVRDSSRPALASPSIDDLVAAARATRTATSPYPLGVRVDGYWFVPWLRAEQVELSMTGRDGAQPGIEGDGAVRALAKFAALFGDVAPPPPPAGSEAPDELRRWNMHEIAYWVTGPWQLGALADRDRLVIGPLAHAPRGGQVLVVPACAKRPDDGWQLARALTEPAVQLQFAAAFTTVPTRTAALRDAPPIAIAIYDALKTAEPLPQSVHTPLLFDDLNPALAAAISLDATPEEAIAGVRRGWRRLTKAAP